MITISDSVKQIISGSDVALESMRAGILNNSAFAEQIRPEIESKVWKPVKKGSIVVALSRIKSQINNIPKLKPDVIIESISVKSPLGEISFEKTKEVIRATSLLSAKLINENGFLTITQGINEITIIYPEHLKDIIIKHFKIKPKGEYDNLMAVNCSFVEENYIEVPNMIFSLVSALASKRINIIEIVSTFTELSFIIRNKDMQETIDALKKYFR